MNLLSLFNKKDKKTNQRKLFLKVMKKNLEYISQFEVDPNGINNQFVKSDTRDYLTIGEIDCPSGKIIASDPAGLDIGEAPVLNKNIPKGKYKVEVSICKNEYFGIRICTARLKIKNTKAIRYICAEPTIETAWANGKDGVVTGFPVETGFMALCDEQVGKEYKKFVNENTDENYFEKFFLESKKKLPQYQAENGSFIEWTNPNTENKMIIMESGLGDGFYQSFWGYDNKDEICELIVPMLNPDLLDEE